MKPLVLDTETTIYKVSKDYKEGSCYSLKNKMCYAGIYDNYNVRLYDIEYSESPYGEKLKEIQEEINEHDIIVLFNAKFDIGWCRRYGISFEGKRVWDCQLVHFMLQGQTCPYPSLNDVLEYYGLPQKLDIVSTEYWDNGIDTDEVPQDILEEYLAYDLKGTYDCYLRQLEDVRKRGKAFERLVSLHNQDLLVLQEIEHNGMLYDEEESKRLGELGNERIKELDEELYRVHGISGFNPGSGDHVSAFLYGGCIKIPRREVVGTYKTGERAGQVKEKWVVDEHIMTQIVKPLPRTELAKEGFYSTAEGTLRSLKGNKEAKRIIGLLLERSKVEKLVGTYYNGIPQLRVKKDWEEGMLHGQFNQCVARTGRLSSSNPNFQNFSSDLKTLFGTRYNRS